MIWSQSTTELALGFGIGLAVGVLVGVERERHAAQDNQPTFAGIRTFPMIALLGGMAGLFAQPWGPLALMPPFLVLGALVCLNYWWENQRREKPDPGLTTEIAALAVFGLAALPFVDSIGLDFYERLVLTGALGAIVMALLSLKAPLHKAAEKISAEDLYATVRFLLLAAVILPLLPDENFGQLQALNPFWIGVVVVLVAGISFVGYIAVKFLGARRGIGITALVGGLASSTAVALSFSERGKKQPELALMCAFAITLASMVMFPRMWVLLAATSPELVRHALLPIGGMLAAGLVGCGVVYWRSAREKGAHHDAEPKFSNPFRLGQALKLGLLFAAVSLVAAAAHDWFGDSGLYVSALLAGLTDVDAITISVARMHAAESVGTGAAVLAITLAAISNTAVKAGIAIALGGRKVGLAVAAVLLPAALAGAILAFVML